MRLGPFFLALLSAAHLFAAANGGTTAIDAAGNVWVAGSTSFLLTTPNAFQKTAAGSVCGTQDLSPLQAPTALNCTHAYLMKQDSSGTVLYATYLSGGSQDAVTALTLDPQGNVYVAGYTYSADFPVTPGALQKVYKGPAAPTIFVEDQQPFGPAIVVPGGDAFVAKFASDGTLVFSTLLGGSGSEVPALIAVDSSGAVYLSGVTSSTDFPVAGSAITAQHAASFFARLSADGAALTYSTYSDPSILAFDVDTHGRAYLTGYSSGSPATISGAPYLTTVDTATGSVLSTTLLTGIAPKVTGAGVAILLTSSQNLYLAVSPTPLPFTFSSLTPPARTLGASSLLELPLDASRVLAETDINQTQFDSLQLDSAGDVYAFGHGTGAIPAAAIQLLAVPCSPGGGSFALEFNPSASLLASTYFRQSTDATVAIPAPGHLLLYRPSAVPQIPATTLSFDISSQPAANFSCPQNLASGTAGVGLAPGEIFLLTGTGLGPAQGIGAVPNAAGQYPTSLGGVQVLIGSKAMPLLYVQANEIHAVATFALPSPPILQVQYNNQTVPALDAFYAPDNPGIFSTGGQGAIVNQDGTVNSPANPAKLGAYVSIYCTGTGYLETPVTDGQVASLSQLIVTELGNPEVTFAGVPGVTVWSGAAPGLIFGLTQINVQLPAALPAGAALAAVPVVLNTDGVLSPPVFISVKL